MAQDRYVYFLYSEQQKKSRTELEAKLCRNFVPGKVFVNGQMKRFTEMSSKSSTIYPDTVIITEGYISTFKYTPPTAVSAKR